MSGATTRSDATPVHRQGVAGIETPEACCARPPRRRIGAQAASAAPSRGGSCRHPRLPTYFEAANLGARWNCHALPCAPDGDIGEPFYLSRGAGHRLTQITFGNICTDSFLQRGADSVPQDV